MTDYKPGTVAKATVRGVSETVMRVSGLTGKLGWRAAGGWFHDHEVTDVLPLVVLDLDAMPGCWADRQPASPVIEPIVEVLRNTNSVAAHSLADQIEKQTRPAIEEPTGLGAVVEDADGDKWMRVEGDEGDAGRRWMHSRIFSYRTWAQVKPVRVLSEGVQP